MSTMLLNSEIKRQTDELNDLLHDFPKNCAI